MPHSENKEVVQPYQPIQKLEDSLFCVDGEWYDTAFKRRMTILRLKDGSLMIHSAIRLKEEDLPGLEKNWPNQHYYYSQCIS